jgi:hypothetical protein
MLKPNDWLNVSEGKDSMALTAEDRLGIQELIYLYCVYADMDVAGRKAWNELFEPDGQWIAQTAQLRTREDFTKHSERPPKGPSQANAQHWCTNTVIKEGKDGEAEVRSDVLVLQGNKEEGTARVTFMGTYEDIVHKVDGRWKFKLRTMKKENIKMVSGGIQELFRPEQ